jgi:bacterial leucyl aminopeptidase
MRAAFAIALVAACAPPPPQRDDVAAQDVGQRYITIGVDAVSALGIEPLETTGEAAIVAIDASELGSLSEQMHDRFQRCGGFIVEESYDAARAQLGEPADAFDGGDGYTLDRAAVVEEVLPALDANAILGTIGELSAMRNRYYLSESGAAASSWLRERWLGYARNRSDVSVELVDHGYPQKSVVMTIRGTTRPQEVIVIGGHLDSIARGGRAANAPGADDDASGIATLSEVARVLLAKNYRPERTIQFMAYAAEEVGLRGSLAIAKDYKKRGVNVVGALQLDMTNYQGSDRDIWLIDDHTSRPQNAFLVKLIETYTDATWSSDVCGYACSDHASWNRYGFRASMPFEARFRDMNRSIHTADDTLERSANNAAHAVKFARLGAAYAIELGKGELAPQTSVRPPAAPHDGNSPPSPLWALFGLALAYAMYRRAT